VNFVDKQHVVFAKVSQYRRQVTLTLNSRAACNADVYVKLVGNNVGKRGFAKARRPEQKHMVKRFAALCRRLYKNLHILFYLVLPDIFGKTARTQAVLPAVGILFPAGNNSFMLVHYFLPANTLSTCLIISSHGIFS